MLLSAIALGVSLQLTFGTGSFQQGPAITPPTTQTPEKDKCTLSGMVTNIQTGEPVKKVTLHLTLRNVGRPANGVFEQSGYSGTSAADGSFTFEGITPGEYSLSAEKSGFVRTQYGSKNGTGDTTLTLSAGQKMTGVKLTLVPQAIITGRVLDDDADPIGGITVQAIGRSWGQGGKLRYFPSGNATTDDTGAYRIPNLSPGKYYVMAQDSHQQALAVDERAGPHQASPFFSPSAPSFPVLSISPAPPNST